MTALVIRDDLSQRTALSKSVLAEFDRCQTKVWWGIHDPKPFVPVEQVTFGSCLDAAIEVVVKFLRMGQEPEWDRVMDASIWIAARDGIAIDQDEVEHACRRFLVDVAPNHDWTHVQTQESLTATIEGLGECNGHPDFVFPDEVWDLKGTVAKNAKDPHSLELAFYAVLREAVTGVPVRRVGYIEWRRGAPNGALKEGKWGEPSVEVTSEFKSWALGKSAAFVNAKRGDVALNAKRKREGLEPINYTMPGGASWAKLCNDCPYAPRNGGRCGVAYGEETAA